MTAPPRAWREGESVESRRAFLEKLAREHQRVWLVLSHAHSGERRVISSAMQDTLADLYPSRDERHFKGVHVLVAAHTMRKARGIRATIHTLARVIACLHVARDGAGISDATPLSLVVVSQPPPHTETG